MKHLRSRANRDIVVNNILAMYITMLKKRLLSGEPCRKCIQATELLKKRGHWQAIDEVVWALESASDSEGMVLAAKHGVEVAPFFVVRNEDGSEEIYVSALKLIKEKLQGPGPEHAATVDSKSAGPSLQEARDANQNATPSELVRYALTAFGAECAIAFSGSDDVVLIDLAAQTGLPFSVVVLDTGRLHGETYRFIEKVRKHYGIDIHVTSPQKEDVESLVAAKGLFSFFDDGHKECCQIRKVAPLGNALKGYRAWMTGQRKDQSLLTRSDLQTVEIDESFVGLSGPLMKFNPIANWSRDFLWQNIRDFQIPHNELHHRGFASIGCEPCTRAVLPGQHEREGRWWWEDAQVKECGLHMSSAPQTQVESVQTDGLQRAFERIDAVNGDDPTGAAVLYSQRMTQRLHQLISTPSEQLQIACRAQHIERWKHLRSEYPEGRAGYKAWRANLLKVHARRTAEILEEVGFDAPFVERVELLIQKRNRTGDAESQCLEDTACLVFLEHEFDAFVAKHDDDKLVSIVQKTWRKMSPAAHAMALQLPLAGRGKEIVERAIG